MRIPTKAPSLTESLQKLNEAGTGLLTKVLGAGVAPTPGGKYRHWDVVRRLKPPEKLTTEEWWFGIKLARSQLHRPLPLTDPDGRPFLYALPDNALEMFHRIDQRLSGEITVSEVVVNPEQRQRYVIGSLIEEAITSSQLEGANTTRQVAKQMLRTGRPPRTKDEQMIVNNFAAMNYVREMRREKLTPALVLELHELVTSQTMDAAHTGRIQGSNEDRVVVSDMEGPVLHTPPPADQLADRLDLMCRFANGEVGTEGFVHPVLRAVLLHFWLAYDHPFLDGNGRTARALFYWSMLSQGYWMTEFLSISRILRAAPAQYARSFLHTETDDNDTTYFVLYQLEVICRAIDDLFEYLGRKMQEVRQVEKLIRQSVAFNHRQLALLSHALRHPDASYTFQSHAGSHNVVYQSGRTDLLDLERRGLLTSRKIGKRFVFSPVRDLAEHLQSA